VTLWRKAKLMMVFDSGPLSQNDWFRSFDWSNQKSQSSIHAKGRGCS